MKDRSLAAPPVVRAVGSESKTSDKSGCSEMAFRGVRSSKFRHVYGSPSKKESCYEGVRITKNAHDSNFCCVNPKFVAVVVESAGGGSFVVLPIGRTGRVDINTPKVCGHRGQILDIKWYPFDDHVIASASEDTTIKIWRVPESGLSTNLTEFISDLRLHSRRVAFIEWHPTAEHVLASAGYDYKIVMWKTTTATPLTVITCHPDTIYSFCFNRDGSQIATTCKDKIIRVIDARSGQVLEEGPGHQGPKSSKVAFLGNLNKLFTTGFSRGSDRQYAVWDANDLSKPLKMDAVDCSSGVLFPFYDHDTRVVFVAGKGDGNIRYYEIVDEKPYCHYLSEFKSSAPQRGMGFMPKRGVDPAKCEIMRFFKLYATKDFVEPISMIVPRKSEAFQDDLFPDCPGMVPSLTADEWKAGQTRGPILSSMRDEDRNAVRFHHGDEGIISPAPHAPDPFINSPPHDRHNEVVRSEAKVQPFQQQQQPLQQQQQQQQQHPQYRRQSESNRIPASIMNIAKNSASEAVVKIPPHRFNDNAGSQQNSSRNNNVTQQQRPGLDRANTIIGTTPTHFTQKSKQWSSLTSPSNGQPSWENVIPKTDSELRRAYFKLQDEVRDLKEQLSLKDRRILELENQLAQLRNNPHCRPLIIPERPFESPVDFSASACRRPDSSPEPFDDAVPLLLSPSRLSGADSPTPPSPPSPRTIDAETMTRRRRSSPRGDALIDSFDADRSPASSPSPPPTARSLLSRLAAAESGEPLELSVDVQRDWVVREIVVEDVRVDEILDRRREAAAAAAVAAAEEYESSRRRGSGVGHEDNNNYNNNNKEMAKFDDDDDDDDEDDDGAVINEEPETDRPATNSRLPSLSTVSGKPSRSSMSSSSSCASSSSSSSASSSSALSSSSLSPMNKTSTLGLNLVVGGAATDC